MRFVYSEEQLEFLRREYKRLHCRALTRAFNEQFGTNKSWKAIRSVLRNYGITSGRPPGFTKGERRMLTDQQTAFLEETFRRYPIKVVTWMFNETFDTWYTVDQLKAYATRHGIRSGRTGQFRKNQRPWNAGTKGLMKPNSGCFQPGHVDPNHVNPLGHERIDSKDGHIMIKVAEQNPYTGAPTRYRPKAHVVWEQHHGQPVPEGCVIRFMDGNVKNCDPDNLFCVTKAEHVHLNKRLKFLEQPIEHRPTLITLARLECKTNELQREAS